MAVRSGNDQRGVGGGRGVGKGRLAGTSVQHGGRSRTAHPMLESFGSGIADS